MRTPPQIIEDLIVNHRRRLSASTRKGKESVSRQEADCGVVGKRSCVSSMRTHVRRLRRLCKYPDLVVTYNDYKYIHTI